MFIKCFNRYYDRFEYINTAYIINFSFVEGSIMIMFRDVGMQGYDRSKNKELEKALMSLVYKEENNNIELLNG